MQSALEEAVQQIRNRAKSSPAKYLVEMCLERIEMLHAGTTSDEMLAIYMAQLNTTEDPKILSLAQQLALLQNKSEADWQRIIDWT